MDRKCKEKNMDANSTTSRKLKNKAQRRTSMITYKNTEIVGQINALIAEMGSLERLVRQKAQAKAQDEDPFAWVDTFLSTRQTKATKKAEPTDQRLPTIDELAGGGSSLFR